MENIRQAVERAKSGHHPASPPQQALLFPHRREYSSKATRPTEIEPAHREITLSSTHLLSRRIIAHDKTDPRSRSFDMLRTQVLRAMDLKGWNILAVTSPTPGCGKTVTALNLALSIARQPERPVILADMDLRKPQIASCLGLQCEDGMLGVLDGRIDLASALVEARIGDHRLGILPAEMAIASSSEVMSSSQMAAMLGQLKQDYQSRTVILDLPPVLSGDDVIAILPRVDCVLLVVAAGLSTVPEIEECARHLQSADVVRVVVTKATDPTIKDYYY
jgi:protein-tyrosine kinase